jgi:hypothetical protein
MGFVRAPRLRVSWFPVRVRQHRMSFEVTTMRRNVFDVPTRWAAALAPLVLALGAPPVWSVSILVSSQAEISAQSNIISPAFSAEAGDPVDPADRRVEFGAPVTYETLVATTFHASGGQWFGFPPDVQHPDATRAFASAKIDGSGTGAVGVSGWMQSLNDGETGSLFALARIDSDIINVGDEGDVIEAVFHIPRIELVLGPDADGGPAFDNFADGTGVFASVEVETFGADGISKGKLELFDYSLTLNASKTKILVAADLVFDAGTITDVSDVYLPGTTGIRVEPFDVTHEIIIGVGETVLYSYVMFATLQSFGYPVADGVTGGHAYFGDPLDLSGSGQASFVLPGVAPLTAVPLPGTLGLLLAGLVWTRGRGASGRRVLRPVRFSSWHRIHADP